MTTLTHTEVLRGCASCHAGSNVQSLGIVRHLLKPFARLELIVAMPAVLIPHGVDSIPGSTFQTVGEPLRLPLQPQHGLKSLVLEQVQIHLGFVLMHDLIGRPRSSRLVWLQRLRVNS